MSSDFYVNETLKFSFQVQTDSIQKNDNIFADYDVDNLSNFLNRVMPYVSSVLDKNVKSKAFLNYDLLSDLESSSITCLHILERTKENEVNFLIIIK